MRFGNLTMTNHPIHMHGYDFKVSCTDGGWVPEAPPGRKSRSTARSAQMRAFEFVADDPGDWAIHCHKSHHTMNAMGHHVANYIGVDKRDVAKKIRSSCPTTWRWASRHGGHGRDGDAAAGQHAADDDRLRPVRPDRDGRHVLGRQGPRGTWRPDDYKDPGWYKHPEGSVAYEWNGARQASRSAPAPG